MLLPVDRDGWVAKSFLLCKIACNVLVVYLGKLEYCEVGVVF